MNAVPRAKVANFNWIEYFDGVALHLSDAFDRFVYPYPGRYSNDIGCTT
jgi:hypothetical protein